VSSAVYDSDPDQAPDSEFVPGELGCLVVGNAGRLLDARRTPITITAVNPELGMFEVQIDAFEDVGTRWRLPVEDAGHFQITRDASPAAPEMVACLEAAVVRFDRIETIECDPGSREATLRRLATERRAFRDWVARHGLHGRDLAGLIEQRKGDPALFALLERFLADRGIADLDRSFSEIFVSNPSSGELIKGHAVVLAELGLCTYHGKIIRDPCLFDEPWSKARRAEHMIARLAFSQELWSGWGPRAVTLYRGAAVDGPLPPRAPASFVSATFSSDVARAHFEGGPATQTAVLWRQVVPITRLFMTFVETPAMNRRFNEAEAVLIGEPGNRAF
jgi:hypothetical protein